MNINAIFAAHARSRLLNVNGGTSVTYKAPNADAVTLTAVLGPITSAEDSDDSGRKISKRRWAFFGTESTAEGGGVASVRLDATIEIGDETWAIDAIEAGTESYHRVTLVLIGRSEVSEPGYRGNA